MNRRLVVVQCGGRKVWDEHPDAGPTSAKDAYTSAYFQRNRAYAERFGDAWMILSAKYGFLEPWFLIPENYNASFKKRSSHPITEERLRQQVEKLNLSRFEDVEVLAGQDYVSIVRKAFGGARSRILTPFAGLRGIGYMQQKISQALRQRKPMDV